MYEGEDHVASTLLNDASKGPGIQGYAAQNALDSTNEGYRQGIMMGYGGEAGGYAGYAQAASGLVGSIINSNAQRDANQKNYEMQKEFAQNGIRWRMADAMAAGIHPLVAMGAQTHSPSPSYVADNNVGNAVSNMGQDISRAVAATQSNDEREYTKLMSTLALQNAQLRNDLLRSQIARMGPGQTGPGMPVQDIPLRRTMSTPGKPDQEVGSVADYGYADIPGGGKTPIPSKDIKERIEDNWVQETLHGIRNNLMPNIVPSSHTPSDPLPKGQRWKWDHSRQGYFPFNQAKYDSDVKKRYYKSGRY